MIREATEDDIIEITQLVKRFMSEGGPFFKFNKEKVINFLSMAVDTPLMYVAVAEQDSFVVGFIIGLYQDHPYVDTSISTEIGFYIDPRYRGGTKAVKLLKSFENWSKQMNAKEVVLSDVVSIADQSVFYGKLGYSPGERVYVKELV